MLLRDLGPFVVFRHGNRTYVKSGGTVQRLDRSGGYFDGGGTFPELLDAHVTPFDLSSPLAGSACVTCYGSGYAVGKWDDPLHGRYARARCPLGCPVEGEPAAGTVTVEEAAALCECCSQPICDQPASTTAPAPATTASRAPLAAS